MAKNTSKFKNVTSFKEGNKAAEKWTVETVMPILTDMLQAAKDGRYVWLGDALVNSYLYKDIWIEWKEKFKDNEPVFRTIKQIEQCFENNQYKGALNGQLVASVAIFGLKNNHGWRDKSETDLTTGGQPFKPFNISELYTPPKNDSEET